MKKRKTNKIIISIAAICMILGSLILGAGLVSGGSLRYLSVNANTVSWWPFPFGSVGIGDFYEEDGDFDYNKNMILDGNSLADVKSIEIEADAADIKIYQGSTNNAYYKGEKTETVTKELANGKLSIRVKHEGLFSKSGGTIVLELTKDMYDEIVVDCAVGRVSVDDVRAKSFHIKADLGDVELEDIYSENTTLEASCGQIKVEGRLLGKSRISNDLGNTEITINGNPKDYRYHVKNSLGNTEIMGSTHNGSANLTDGYANAAHEVDVDSAMGNVELEFD